MAADPRDQDRGEAEDAAWGDLRRGLLDSIRTRRGPRWADFQALEAHSVAQAAEFLLTWLAWRELSERELRLSALLGSRSALAALGGREGAGWEDLGALTLALARGVGAVVQTLAPGLQAEALGAALEAAAQAPSEAAIARVDALLAPVLQGPPKLKRAPLSLVLDELAQLYLDLALARPADAAGEHAERLSEQLAALRASAQAPALVRALLRFGL